MDANIVVTQISAASIVVWAMEQLKNAQWFPLLQAGRKYVSRIVSIGSAFLIHGGISYTWNPVFDANGNRHLDLAIPAASVIFVYLWHWFGQFTIQELIYQGTLNKTPVKAP